MSCSKCGSVTASCGCKDTAYTTPKVYTCPPDTSCPQPVRCSEFMDAACIFLNDGIADAGIQPGSSLESIVQQLILLATNPGCVDAPGGVPGGGTVTFIDAVWPGNAITIADGPIFNSGTFVFNGNGNSSQYIDGQGNLQPFPAISDPVEFQTNGTPNSTQVLLNLVAGTGITLTESGGSVTIDADANIYTVDNGLSPDPTDANNFQLGSETSPGAPLIHDTYIAGAQFRFEINNTNSMFLEGNRVDIESGAAGAMMLSTGGAADSSVEVTGVEVSIQSETPGNATRIFLDPLKIRIQTPLYNLKNDGDVLTLIDKTTGEVEYMPVVGILLQTDGSDNADQALLNLVSGNGITLTNTGGDVVIDGPLFQTNGTDNTVQTLLNLVAGTGITLTESAGSVTIDAAAPAINLTTFDFGGPATYNSVTGDLNIPIYQTQLDIQDEGSTVVINPDWLNFIGDGVTVTLSGTGADIVIAGGQYNGDQGVWKETSSLPETFMLGAPLGSGTAIKFLEDREVDVDTNRLEMIGSSNILRLIESGATPADTDAALVVASDTTFYAGTFTGVNNPALLAYTTGTDTYALEVTNLGTGTSSYAALFQSDPGYGIQVNSLLHSSFYLNATGSSNNSIDNVLYIWKNTTGVASVGEGTSITMSPGTDGTGSLITDGVVLNSILSASTDVEFRIDTTNAGSLQPSTTFKGDGEIRFHEYGVGAFLNPAAYILGVDAFGNVVETVAGGGGGGGSYDSNNGVYNNLNIFQLGVDDPLITGADFQTTRYINANTYSLNINGPGNIATSGVLNVSGGNYGIEGKGNIRGVSGVAIGGTASSFGGYFEGFTAIYGISLDSGGRGIEISLSGGLTMNSSQMFLGNGISYDNADQIYNATRVARSIVGTPPLQNFGISHEFALSVNSSGIGSVPVVSNKFVSKLYDPIEASAKTQFEIQGLTNGAVSLTPQFTILGGGTSGAWSLTAGQIRFNQYAAGAIYKSATDLSANLGYNLGIDANGNIWATDFSTGGGGGSGVSSVSGAPANGFTVGVTNPTTNPTVTVGTTVTGVLVGDGTGVSAVTGTGVMVFSGTGYTFQAFPTVNNGALNVAMGTNAASGIAVQWGTATGFTANIATNIQYDLRVGPALVNFATYMSQVLPANPTPGAGVLATRPVYIRKSAIDNYTDATPVTTFSPGTTGFTVTSGYSTATALGINENVVLGGVLNVSSGGTGLSTTPGNGQILIGNGTGYTLANISGGDGINIINSAGGIQIQATGLTGPSPLNGIHIHVSDGSIRLGSGTPADGDIIRPLIERTDIRMNNQIYRLSTDNTGIITNIGFQINDGTTARNGFFGSSSGGTVDTANTPEVAYVFSGAGGTALTSYNGFYIDNTVSGETKVYSGFSSSVRQVITRSGTAANNKLTQIGTWGNPGTANSTFYEAIPSARTIQIGATAGNNNWIKLDDSLQRVDINKSTIYASGYGSGAITSGTGLTYLIGTDVGGKFFEFAGRSISQITGNTGSTFSAASMASATSHVPFSIVGTGSISTNIAGNVLTISNAATAFPYWSNITTAATVPGGGTVTGPSTITPQVVGANTFQFNAGAGIGIRTVAPAVGSATGALLEITNNGILNLTTGGTNAFTIVPTVGSPGALTLNIPYQWRTVNLTNTGAVPAGSTNATSLLTPITALTDITFNGGPGVTINTNTTSRIVTISATGGSSLPSTNGVWQHPDSTTPTEYRLGSDTDGPSTFTQNRWINAQGNFLQIKGTPATGDANGILKLLSTAAGRGLRVENSNNSPDGAIYATSAQLTSTDAAPTGTIYGNSSGVGSAIVGDGSDTAGASTRPAIFGKGYIGVKGSSTTAQAAGLVAGGVGVYGTAVVASGSSYGVIGSSISATDILLPNTANTKTGVYGEAPGNVRANGFAQDITSYGGRFVINASGNTAAPQSGNIGDINIARGLRSLVNVGDVVQLIRYSNTAPVTGIGGALVFNVETNTDNGLGDGQKAGRVGYKISRVISPIDSRFFVTTSTSNTLDGTQIELERFAIRNTGQAELSSYAALDPAVSNIQGQFIPTESTLTGYTDYYDYSTLGVKTNSATNNEERGRIDTLRTRHGQYDPSTIVADGTTGYAASNMSVSINRAYFSSLNNIVTVHVAGSISFSSGGASSVRNFSMPLPIAASTALLTGDVIVSITFNNYSTYSYLGLVSSQGIAGATQRYRINVDTTASLPLSASMPFSAIFTYKLI